MTGILLKSLFLFFVFKVAYTTLCFAQVPEGDQKFFKGGEIKLGNLPDLTEDNKFGKPEWATIDLNNPKSSVKNVITLDIIDPVNSPIPANFSCVLGLEITYRTFPDIGDQIISNVNLQVDYSTTAGAKYKISDSYRFINGYRVKLNVKSITINGSSVTAAPEYLQLINRVVINRTYKYVPDLPIWPLAVFMPSGKSDPQPGDVPQLKLSWPTVSGGIPGAEEYDVEWTTVDVGSTKPANTEILYKNNASRITTPGNTYVLSLIYNTKYLAVRIRQVHYTEGIRQEAKWDYSLAPWNISSLSHEPNLNWQYSASYAEEGKKKEVISYFDGTLRGRQTATLNNSDQVAVVQENIYDEFGRPMVSILPAPVQATPASGEYLHYIKNFNLNAPLNTAVEPAPYSFQDFVKGCEIKPGKLNTSSGASNYYSPANKFLLNGKKYNSYIPNADGYPFSVTQYTPDNTNRIRIQGGVGATFQPGGESSKTTKYYYSKPEQWELDQLFGNDVGFASHYLKNMVIDPNGQVSISYLNASGKTIATALTGNSPESQDGLKTGLGNEKKKLTILLRPEQFTFNGTSLKLKATTTYTSSIPGAQATLSYDIERLLACYKEGTFTVCSNCYYDLAVKVKDDCGLVVYDSASDAIKSPFTIGSKELNQDPDVLKNKTASLTPFNLPKIGEYFIDFELSLSREAIDKHTDRYITGGQVEGSVKKELTFIMQYLNGLDLSGLGDCNSAAALLANPDGFKSMFTKKLDDLKILPPKTLSGEIINPARTDVDELINKKYESLKAASDARQPCPVASPCLRYALLMEEDVSPPTGQYALFDKEGHMLEPELNVLQFWRKEFPINNKDVNGVVAPIPKSDMITISEDGKEISPYDDDEHFKIADLVKYWKPEWASKFVKYHPEHCKLEACEAEKSIEALNWDQKIQETIDKAPVEGVLGAIIKYDRQPGWLLEVDPFFIPKSNGVEGGLGKDYYISMKSDLEQYTSRILLVTDPTLTVKSLPGLIDYLTYCAQTNTQASDFASKWSQCAPVANCRVLDREWRDYRDKYFELKENYYKAYRDKFCKDNYGEACPVGTAISLPLPGILYTYDFIIEEVSSSKLTPVCGLDQQRIRIACMKGNVGKAITVQVEYPDPSGNTIKIPVVFESNQSERFICIPEVYYLKNTIKISNIIQ